MIRRTNHASTRLEGNLPRRVQDNPRLVRKKQIPASRLLQDYRWVIDGSQQIDRGEITTDNLVDSMICESGDIQLRILNNGSQLPKAMSNSASGFTEVAARSKVPGHPAAVQLQDLPESLR